VDGREPGGGALSERTGTVNKGGRPAALDMLLLVVLGPPVHAQMPTCLLQQ